MPPSLNSSGKPRGRDAGTASQAGGPAERHSPENDRAEIVMNPDQSGNALDVVNMNEMPAGPAESPAGQEAAELQVDMSDQADTGSMAEVGGQGRTVSASATTGNESRRQETAATPAGDTADQMAAAGTEGQDGRRASSALPLTSLIVLALGGLVFLIVHQPKSRKKKEQQRRGDI